MNAVLIINCRCCGLTQRIRDRDGAVPKICDLCHSHQGKLPDKVLARAQSHEQMLRERLEACRASEKQAQAVAKRAKERVASALSSRGALAQRIVNAASTSGTHHCPAQEVGRDPFVIRIADQHFRHDYGDYDQW